MSATGYHAVIVAVPALLLCWAIASGFYLYLSIPGGSMFGLCLFLAGLVTMVVGVVTALFGVEGAILGGVGVGFLNVVLSVVLVFFSPSPYAAWLDDNPDPPPL